MDRFDEKLRAIAAREPNPAPDGYAERISAVCAGLNESARPGRKKPSFSRWISCAAAVLALFIAVPNLSPSAAAAMADIPVLGAIVEIITIRNYTYDSDRQSAELTVPELAGGSAAIEVSEEMRNWTDQLIVRFEEECEDAVGSENVHSLYVTYEVLTDSDAWFTLRLDAEEIRAGGYQVSRIYHIDKSADRAVSLSDLFRDDADYVTTLSNEVRRQMETLLAKDSDSDYFTDEFTAIKPEQNFYWNEAGSLVLVFDEYTIAPGSMGMLEFTIPAAVYESMLK